MRSDTCTTCGGAFKSDREGLWSGDKREHRCESTCIKYLKQRLAASDLLLREKPEFLSQVFDQVDDLTKRLAVAEARNSGGKAMTDILIRLRDEATDLHNNGVMSLMDKAADTIESLTARLDSTEAELIRLRMAALRASGWRECEDPDEAKGGDHGTDRGVRRD